ncbi:acyltransferase family protein [Marinactinospora rubrisoli]|uniref:Acyltransferase family protein n=1 Tax=Marinactinospora rubrisoli TaxID=2715399 RepID=A0ABW2KIG0_9ACTN
MGAHGLTSDVRGPSGPKERLVWADVAKGACIVLVVLWHVIMKHFLQVQWNIPVPLAGAWGAAGEVLLPLRMPLFFAISGFFAAGALARPWRVVGRSKVAKFFYLYALWLLIHTAVFSFVPEDFDTARAGSFGELLAQLTISPTNLWYLYALALYFVLAKVLRPVPPLVMLAVAFVVSAAASAELIPTPGDRKDLFENLLFFLAGAYGKSYLARVATAANWPRFFAVAVPYVGILAVTYYLGADTWFGLMPTISFVAVFLGVTAASLITRWEALANGLVSLGRRTLPIYVMHMPVLALLHAVLVGLISSAGPTVQLVVAAVEPLVLTAVVVAICLGLYRILPTKWLFDLPGGPVRTPAKEGAGR